MLYDKWEVLASRPEFVGVLVFLKSNQDFPID